jgi:hypothetical protein
MIEIHDDGAADLLDKSAHQPQTMSLAVGLRIEPPAAVANRHGSHGIVSNWAAHRHTDRTCAIRKRMIVAVRYECRENNSQRRYCIEIEHHHVAVANQRNSVVRDALDLS